MEEGTPDIRPWHYDGRNACRWHPRIAIADDSFRLIGEDWENGPYRWADLVALDGTVGRSIYGLKDESGWRLGFDGPPPPDFAAHLPKPARYGGWIDGVGLTRAVAAFAVVAAAVIYIGVEAPGWIAPLVPRSWEEKLGEAMVGDFGGRFCRTPQGVKALDTLIAKMDPDADARAIEIANVPMVNAVALPGGRIILFDGLIQAAASGDEVAGVLGHELGHVRHRDTMAGLMRQLGLSVVLGGFSGDVGGYVNGLLSLSYGRDAEARADVASIATMKAANISPADTAQFFARMSKGEPEGGRMAQAMTWLSSHPLSAKRRALFASSAVKGHRYAPALSPREWQALRAMCKSDPTVKSGWRWQR